MDELIKWMGFAIQLLPLVLKGVFLAEDAIGSGNGQAKKAMVMGSMLSATPPGADMALASGMVGKLVDGVVAPLNAAGKLPPHRASATPTR